MDKLIVAYKHESADLRNIYLAIGGGIRKKLEWIPAYRDIINGELVVWIRVDKKPNRNDIWVRDSDGTRKVAPRDVK